MNPLDTIKNIIQKGKAGALYQSTNPLINPPAPKPVTFGVPVKPTVPLVVVPVTTNTTRQTVTPNKVQQPVPPPPINPLDVIRHGKQTVLRQGTTDPSLLQNSTLAKIPVLGKLLTGTGEKGMDNLYKKGTLPGTLERQGLWGTLTQGFLDATNPDRGVIGEKVLADYHRMIRAGYEPTVAQSAALQNLYNTKTPNPHGIKRSVDDIQNPGVELSDAQEKAVKWSNFGRKAMAVLDAPVFMGTTKPISGAIKTILKGKELDIAEQAIDIARGTSKLDKEVQKDILQQAQNIADRKQFPNRTAGNKGLANDFEAVLQNKPASKEVVDADPINTEAKKYKTAEEYIKRNKSIYEDSKINDAIQGTDASFQNENTIREALRARKDWNTRALRGEKENDISTKIKQSYGEAVGSYVGDSVKNQKDQLTDIWNKANTPVNKKLESIKAGKPNLQGGYIQNPLAGKGKSPIVNNQVVSSKNNTILRTKIDGVPVNSETLSRIKQAEQEGLLPNQKAGLSPDVLDERKLRLDLQKEALDQSPLKTLTKYANKYGVLPEVTGKGRSHFSNKGDQILDELGFTDTEIAHRQFKQFNKQLNNYRASKRVLINDTKTYRINKKAVTEIEKAYVPLKRMTDAVKTNVTKSVKRVEMKSAQRQVAFEKREAVRQVAKKRDEVTAILKQKASDIQSVKRVVTTYVTENLSMADRGKAITLIRDAKTQKDVTKAYIRIQRVADERVKKELISTIKKTVNSLPQSVEIGYRNKVTNLLNEIELSGHSAKSVEQLRNTEKYLNEQQALGKDVAMPKRILEKLKILSRTSAKDLTSSQLAGLRDEVELLKHLGKTKQRIKTELYEVEKAYILDELVQTIKPLNYKTIVNVPGTTPSLRVKTKNKFKEIYNRAKKVRVAIRPIDGLAEATGMEQMKNKMDLNYGNYLDHNVTFIKDREALLASSKLDKKNMERIGVYAAKMQEGGYAKLENLDISRVDADAIVLTQGEQTYYNFGRTWFEEDYSNVKNYMQEVYNKDVGKVDNYVSFQTDFKAMSELEIQDQFGTLADDAIFKSKTVKKDFTEARSGAGTQKIKLDFDSILLRHRDNVAYMLNMGKDIKMYSEIVNNPTVRAKLGDLGTFAWKEWLDLMARKGGIDGQKQMAGIDMLRRNFGVGVMSYKLSTVLIQLSSLADAAATVGGKWTSIGAYDVASSKVARKFVLDNFPEIRQAVGDDIAFLELGDTFLGKAGQVGFVPLKRIDALARSTTALAAYRKIASDRGLVVDFTNPNKSIIQEATKLVRQSQGSSSFKDSPLALTRGMVTGNVSADKAIFQFQSFMLNRWENIERQVWRQGFGKGDYIKGFTAIFWMIVAAGVIEEGSRRTSRAAINLITGEDKEEDPFVETVITNTTRNVPIAGNIMNSLAYDSNPVPIINAAETTLGGFKRTFTGVETPTKIKGAVDAGLGTANALLGVPGTVQIGQLIKPFISKEKGSGNSQLDTLIKEQKATQTSDTEKVDTLTAEIKAKGGEAGKAQLLEIAKANPELAKKVIKNIQEESFGLTNVDKALKQLGVENGARADYIVTQIKKLNSQEEKKAYLLELYKKKIITNEVMLQITEQLK